MTHLTRRMLLAAAAAAACTPFTSFAAAAVSTGEAEKFVSGVLGEIESLIKSGKPVDQQQADFRQILIAKAAVPQVSRFVMGQTWRDMDEAQQKAFQEAFLTYVSRVYVKLLSRYQGQTIQVTGAKDFGSKGVLVTSVAHGKDVEDTAVEFRVSDRGGDGVKMIDIIIEGVSMLQTQRQEFASMLEKRNGDINRLISDLQTG